MIAKQSLWDSDNDSENSMHDFAQIGTLLNNCNNDKRDMASGVNDVLQMGTLSTYRG